MTKTMSFTDTGGIKLESDGGTIVVEDGEILLTEDVVELAIGHGWSIADPPLVVNTEPLQRLMYRARQI